MSAIEPSRSIPSPHQLREPSARLLRAALLGLIAAGAPACGEELAGEAEPAEVRDAIHAAAIAAATPDAGSAGEGALGDAGASANEVEHDDKIIGAPLEQEFAFSTLNAKCNDLGGYIQVHAICGSVNSCAGFSYYDGDGPKTYLEHSCSAANWCKGYSCVVLPKDAGRTGEDIYVDACAGCHSGGDEQPTFFTVFAEAGSARTKARWPDLSETAHEKIVAFGRNAVSSDGAYYANMPAYHKKHSRAEVERVVKYLRALPAKYTAYPTYQPTKGARR